MENIESLITETGMITTKTITKANRSKTEFYGYIKENNFERVSRGIYITPDTWADPLMIAHMRCPNAVISHDSALYHYRLVDREPSMPTITVYSGYNANRIKASGYKVFYVKKEYLTVGKTMILDFDGNTIPMYSLERTMCDLIRNRNSFEIQDFNTAIKSYCRNKEKNLVKLFEFAKILRVEKLMRTYLEMLL